MGLIAWVATRRRKYASANFNVKVGAGAASVSACCDSHRFLRLLHLLRLSWRFWPQLLLWFTLLETAATGVATGDILSAYIYLLSGSNATVGYIQVPEGDGIDLWHSKCESAL